MKTRQDFREMIRADAELRDIIHRSGSMNKVYKQRSTHRTGALRTKASLACDAFWSHADGIGFRYVMERKYGIDFGNLKIRGAVKDALCLYIAQHINLPGEVGQS